jgi:hypothetical protein
MLSNKFNSIHRSVLLARRQSARVLQSRVVLISTLVPLPWMGLPSHAKRCNQGADCRNNRTVTVIEGTRTEIIQSLRKGFMDILQTGTESRNRGNTNGATRCSAIRPLILIVVCYPPLQMPKALWFTKISCVYHRSLLQHRPPMLAYITSTSPSILASSYKHAFRNERTEHV